MEENWRAIEGIAVIFILGIGRGMRTEGIRNLQRLETAIVDCGRRDAELGLRLAVLRFRYRCHHVIEGRPDC